MVMNEVKFRAAISSVEKYSVFYLYSCDTYLLQSNADKIIAVLDKNQDAQIDRLEGPVPNIDDAYSAAGAISMFGNKRIVYLSMLELSAMKETDVESLVDLCQSLDNAVLIITAIFKDDKAKTTKKAKSIINAAEQNGLAVDLIKPTAADARKFAVDISQSLNTKLSVNAAAYLIERCGVDYYVLENEINKLAAISNYDEITQEMIVNNGTLSIEADVFELVRMASGGNKLGVFKKLDALLELQNEPIAIVGALSSSFIDMYRIKIAQSCGKNFQAVQKDFAYKGSDYRLRKAGETAAHYTREQLQLIIDMLTDLDSKLKSSTVNSTVLLQSTINEIMNCGR